MNIIELLCVIKKTNHLEKLMSFFSFSKSDFEDELFSIILRELFNHEGRQIKTPTVEMIELLKDFKSVENDMDKIRVRNILIEKKL